MLFVNGVYIYGYYRSEKAAFWRFILTRALQSADKTDDYFKLAGTALIGSVISDSRSNLEVVRYQDMMSHSLESSHVAVPADGRL